ncbi:nucleoside hydrolase [Oenococcus kitaharae]|uniref:Inosine-uridine preferring nucleoside hydrolase n=1 Tax=Oenococcus kitaharae DSM 17330 TaxID=1045004 RepID=G9WHM7_9LACO|nr:nucleoside hydrolase [Oenococcus kitaharae]EHN58366.1 Inosine-uridine preferring nucleoside hydrolase [Oenococcus kitaharae DSM 17330]OEY81469.1 ABC transporter substrate-binding protein [Oenococcus kitaharae]OEY82957.1 ABC transporter substrate-binding protein [Oenococcus kitaharae]OEY84499.1 ABC transporter substrate-binding protein [Oenococcus kitaharae]
MKKNVYFSHDGGVDDLVSLLLLMQMEDINLTGVGVMGADSYLEPALSATRKLIDRFGHGLQIQPAASDSRAVHPFPKEWRMDAFSFDAFPLLNESGHIQTAVADKAAHLDLIDKLQAQTGKTTLVMTGPLSDLARALKIDPTITDKIDELYWMGGTLDNKGNVAEPEQDGTIEWNAYWDPQAVKDVWDSSIKIHMVGLESTRQVPLTRDIRRHWASQRKYPILDLIGQGYALVPPLDHFETNSTYFMWDVLTTLYSGYHDVAETKEVLSDVSVSSPSDGRTFETADGRPITLVTKVDHDRFFQLIDELGKKIY